MSKPDKAAGFRLLAKPITRPNYHFDSEQAAAIAHRGSPLILQGATGTGKTITLIEAAIDRVKNGASRVPSIGQIINK